MKVAKIKYIETDTPISVVGCYVGDGYLQGLAGALPDVDNDFDSTRRQEVKEYLERRYNLNGKQRVFSAGTMTTLRAKAVIKDVARTMRIPVSLVNYLTSIFDDDKCDFTGIFRLAAQNKKIANFIHEYPQLFEDIRTLMNQPRSSSIHPSAILVTPDTMDGHDMECFDYTPIKKVDGMLVSEFDGYVLDECGLLKNDCLATKELSKLKQTMDLCNKEYGIDITLEKVATSDLDEPMVFELLSRGFTQNIFQLSSRGMTKFIKEMQPSHINDIIAANALFRPATLENGATTDYVDCKRGDKVPVYLWGTYDALKDTYGLITYQEQVVMIGRTVGNFTLGEGVNLVKFISKKKIDKIKAMQEKFMNGAKSNGCPKEDAEAIWQQIEACGSYLFNRSHATAYAITSYVGAYLKAKYPTAFYTIALQYAEDDELVSLMNEMEYCSTAKVVAPDINKSRESFYTDFATGQIFWSLCGIKMLGLKAVDWIVAEREKHGDFASLEDFIHRVFKYRFKKAEYYDDPNNLEEVQRCPVNARHVRNLILAGCFDGVEGVQSIVERYFVLEKAAQMLEFELSESDFPKEMIGKHHFWSQQQIAISGVGSVDYRSLYSNSNIRAIAKSYPFIDFKDINDDEKDGRKCGVAATVVDMTERTFNSQKTNRQETLCSLLLVQNNFACECTIWPEEYDKFRHLLADAKGKIVVFNGSIKFSTFTETNNIQFTRNSHLEIL